MKSLHESIKKDYKIVKVYNFKVFSYKLIICKLNEFLAVDSSSYFSKINVITTVGCKLPVLLPGV